MIGDYNTDNKCLLINLLKNAKLYIIKYRSNSQNINKVINYLNSVILMSYKYVAKYEISHKKLSLLSDCRIAGIKDKSISFFDPNNKYNNDLTIEDNTSNIDSYCVLDNGNIVTASMGKVIKLYSITKNSYQCLFTMNFPLDCYFSLIAISGNKVCVGIEEGIMIYDFNAAPYSSSPVKELKREEGKSNYELNMFYIKEKNYLIRKNYYKETHVFDLNTYKHVPSLEKCFDGLTYEAFRMIYQIDGKKIFVEFEGLLVIIDFINCTVDAKIDFKGNYAPISVLSRNDCQTLLVVTYDRCLFEVDLFTKTTHCLAKGLGDVDFKAGTLLGVDEDTFVYGDQDLKVYLY